MWTTPVQREFLVSEDLMWQQTKDGPGTLNGFYTRTTNTFLEKWPVSPDAATLEEAKGDVAKAKDLVQGQVHTVSTPLHTTFPLPHIQYSASQAGTVIVTAKRSKLQRS